MSRREEVIAEIARRHGVCLPPDDPVLHIDTMLELSEARIEAREAEREARTEALAVRLEAAKQSAATITPEQIHVLGLHIVGAFGTWIERINKSLDLRTCAILAASAVALMATTLAFDRYLLSRPDISGMRCDFREDHSRVCWFEVAPAPPATPAGKH